MALTITDLTHHVDGDRFKKLCKLVFDSSYPTGGEAVTAELFGLSQIDTLEVMGTELGYGFEYVPTNVSSGKVKVYTGGSAAHTHATGTLANAAITAGTPAGTNDSVSGGTPAGTNATSAVQPFLVDVDAQAVEYPTFALTHAADPSDAGTDTYLYAVPVAGPIGGQARFETTAAGAADTTFSSSNDGSYYNSATQRAYGLVAHNATPTGVQIFVDEADSWKLKADFTTAGSAGNKHVPLRMDSTVVWIKILDEATSGMTPLYYNDNGADNAKLLFLDSAATSRSLNNDNKGTCGRASSQLSSGQQVGLADAQTFTGAVLAGHTHTFTGAAMATHNHTISGSTASSPASVASEVANGTNLNSAGLTAVECEVIGR